MVKKLGFILMAAVAACSTPQSDISQPSQKIGYVIMTSGSWSDGEKTLKPGSPIFEKSRIVRQEKTDKDSITLRAYGSRLYIACSKSSNCPEPLLLHRLPKGALLFPDPVTRRYRPIMEFPERFITTGDRASGNSSPTEAVLIRNAGGLVLTDAIPRGISAGEAFLFCPAAEDGSVNCGRPEDPGALKCETPGSASCSIQPAPGLYWLHMFRRDERYGRAVYDMIDGRKALVLVLNSEPGLAVKNGFREFTAQFKQYAGEQQSPQDRAALLRMYLYEAWIGRER